jgi:hypothetical protein
MCFQAVGGPIGTPGIFRRDDFPIPDAGTPWQSRPRKWCGIQRDDMVFTIDDQEAIGADLAARQLNRTDFFITSVQGAPDIVGSLKQPDSLIESE